MTVIATHAPPASGCLFVLAAPSGGGKTSLVREILIREPGIRLSVSYTTRMPRPGEQDGVHYHFVDEAKFMALKDAGEFLEHAHVHGNWYATSSNWLAAEVQAGHDVRCMFATPKLLESLALKLESKGRTIRSAGITGIFSGGTEFTPQWNRFAHEELLDGAYMTPTYGNTLMGLAASAPSGPHNDYKITYHAPQPRAVIEVVDFNDPNKVVEYGQTGRVKLTTLTKEFFVPGFLERDEGEREAPYEKYPWDGVSGVRPFHEFAATTTVGVY